MCLAVPMKITAIDRERNSAWVQNLGVEVEVCIDLVPDVQLGDYVMIHAGFAIGQVNEGEAAESIALWKEYLQHAEATA